MRIARVIVWTVACAGVHVWLYIRERRSREGILVKAEPAPAIHKKKSARLKAAVIQGPNSGRHQNTSIWRGPSVANIADSGKETNCADLASRKGRVVGVGRSERDPARNRGFAVGSPLATHGSST